MGYRHLLPLAIALAIALAPPAVAAPGLVTPAAVRLEAGSEFEGAWTVSRLIDGSGLSGEPGIANYTAIDHAAASAAVAWTTDAPGGGGADYFALDPAVAPWPVLVFGFDRAYAFTDLVIWGYHFGSANGNESKAFELEFSVDGGRSYGAPVTVSSPQLQLGDEEALDFGAVFMADTIRMTVTDNWFEDAAGGDRAGLGEVRFLADIEPDPPPVIGASASVDFSAPGGTFTGTFLLGLTTTAPGAQIVYTTDGSLPTHENGTPYSGPIAIGASTQVRAATVSGATVSATASQSYVRLAADVAEYRSELPIVVVENFGAGSVPDKGWTVATQTGEGLVQRPRQPAFMGIFDTEEGTGFSSLRAVPEVGSRIGIRVRGAFSSTWDRKPYALESWAEGSDEDEDIAPLGMPPESDWILYFPHPDYDRTMLANTFIWELSGQAGRYGTRFRFVDVFLNEDGGDLRLSDRRGVYALAEKVKRGGDRIDFEPLSNDGATGGWLLSINRMDAEPPSGFPAENGATSPQHFHTPGPDRILQTPPNAAGRGDDIPRQYNAFINFENPNGYRILAGQRAAIEAWFVDFEDVLFDEARWLDPSDGYRRYVNTTDVITYFQLLNLAKQGDGLLLSVFPWVSSGERQLHMGPMWDFNNGAYSGTTNSPLYFRADRLWYPRLFADPSFLREYIDRWFALRRGPLSNANMAAIIDRQSASIPAALVPGQGISLAAWQDRVAGMKAWLAERAGWIDSQYFAPPIFGTPGGVVGPGFRLTVTNDYPQAGTIYYTLDGADPITGNGATPYSGPVTLEKSATVRARTLDEGGNWSALNEDTYILGTPADRSNTVISEIMYHPADGAGDEFIELLNISKNDAIDLTGVAFTVGIDYVFPVGISLAPGARLVVMQADFRDGTRLSNGGEPLELTGADGAAIHAFAYDDRAPWPVSADGQGFSLTLIDPASAPDHSDPASWRRSAAPGGSPGESDAVAFSGDAMADTDRDGIPALLEHAFGTSDSESGGAPMVVSLGADGRLLVEFPRDAGADDLRLWFEGSADLRTWSPMAASLVGVSSDPTGQTTPRERWQLNPADSPTRFVRVVAQQD
ncbi:hypothetical protein BH23VER1_BH23VER1_10050 [soil metagenome]